MGEAFKPSSASLGPMGLRFLPSPTKNSLGELRGRVHGVHCGVFRVTSRTRILRSRKVQHANGTRSGCVARRS